jgi:hypothetical protein
MNIAPRSALHARENLVANEVSILEKTAAVVAVEQMLIQKVRPGWRKLLGGRENA